MQQGLGTHCEDLPPGPGEQPAGGGEQEMVVGLEAGAADLAVEDFGLVSQDHYLKCLGSSRALVPDDQSQDRADDQMMEFLSSVSVTEALTGRAVQPAR